VWVRADLVYWSACEEVGSAPGATGVVAVSFLGVICEGEGGGLYRFVCRLGLWAGGSFLGGLLLFCAWLRGGGWRLLVEEGA